MVTSGERMMIDANVSKEWALLIESCWASDPDRRPSFAKIVNQINGFESEKKKN
jgi:hypothetical protein